MSAVSPALPVQAPKIYDCSAFEEGRTVVQFRDNELILTDMGGRPPDDMQAGIMKDARKHQYSGIMTNQAQKRMTRAITLLSQATKAKWVTNPATGRMTYFKLALVTLTISAHKNQSHKETYKRCLAPMLRWFRYTMGVKHYVWKVELQERGQIHYHIIIPKCIHYKVIRDKWNALQLEAGYLRDYVTEHRNTNPNSTDIHAVGSEKNVSKYLIKYLGKGADTKALTDKNKLAKQLERGKITNEEYKNGIAEVDKNIVKVEGKLWDCNEALNEGYFTVMLKWKLGMVLADYVRDNPDCAYYGERFCSIQIDFSKPPDFMKMVMLRFRMYMDYINAGGRAILN